MNSNLFIVQQRTQDLQSDVSKRGSGAHGLALHDNRSQSSIQRKASGDANPPIANAGEGVVQKKTSVTLKTKNYSYDSNSKHSVAGLSAEAYLDPKYPKNGSAPGGGELEGPMEDLKNLGYRSMIKGHLLNGQLGGPGVAQNLFPITSQANSIHKTYVENHIKSYVSHGDPVFYAVEVTDASYSSQSPNAKFTCEAYPWNPKKGENHGAVDKSHPYLPPIDIESYPVKGTTGSGNAVGINAGTDVFGNKIKKSTYALNPLKFLNNQLAHGWGEEGSGRGQFGRDWSHVK